MTNRVWQNENSFVVSSRGASVDFEVNHDYTVTIEAEEEAGWDSQRVYFTLSEEEAKQLVTFLVAKGY